MIVKVLGFVDICAALMLLAGLFGLPAILQINIFFGGLLLLKSLFLLTGDILSVVDFISAGVFFFGLLFAPWSFLIWICTLLLMSKGVASFL